MARTSLPKNRRDNRFILGLIITVIGGYSLLYQFSAIPSFEYLLDFGWPVVLILIGILMGIRNSWRNNAPYILILIGAVNLIPVFHIGKVSSNDLAGPALLIAVGLFIAFRHKKPKEIDITKLDLVTNGESTLDIDNTMGGRKEIVTSKEFRGGSIRTTFGGTEVNLMQADSSVQPMVLALQVSFGSIELIVPSYWEVINEIRPSMGSVEDHRSMRTPDASYEKRTLILRGSCSFGSIEVKSY